MGREAEGEGARRAITSLQNDSVKLIRSLDMRKARRETGLFVAEGASVLLTARDNGWSPRMLVQGPGPETSAGRALDRWAAAAGADRLDVSAAVLEKIAAKDNPQSVIGVLEQRWAKLPTADEARTKRALWVALEDIRDPGNLGTIIRTCDAAGGNGVIVTGNACDPFAGECVRASMGSLFAVPLARMERNAFAAFASRWPGDVIGTHMEASRDFRSTYKRPSLIMMGSEGTGLSAELSRLCTADVRIPMKGSAESLNVAIAAALMLYEVRRPDIL